jgi:hypothetical protein
MTLASLASSAVDVGQASTSVDNTTDLAVDSLVGGKITVGTTPTANTRIEVWAYGSYDGTTYDAGVSGTDGAFTATNLKTLFRLLTIIPNIAVTSNVAYAWGPFSIAQAFGGTMPRKWGIFVTHNTVAALNATPGNHEVKYTPVKYLST